MSEEITSKAPINFKYYISVRFSANSKSYFFGTNDDSITTDTKVVVDNMSGCELATTCSELFPIENYKSELELKGILRKANKDDLLLYEHNIKRASEALVITQEEVTKLSLDMNLISANFTLDGSKITITYVSENRVDFRELLKNLAPRLKCRIELRQVGVRDRAKSIGGIGVCGLPLCCNSFLDTFDGISINRAKNQMLALNISKLSGQCGKLICCLLYEDDIYTTEKERFPRLGTMLKIEDKDYKITGFNIISNTVKVESEDDIQNLSLKQVESLLRNEKRSKFQKQ